MSDANPARPEQPTERRAEIAIVGFCGCGQIAVLEAKGFGAPQDGWWCYWCWMADAARRSLLRLADAYRDFCVTPPGIDASAIPLGPAEKRERSTSGGVGVARGTTEYSFVFTVQRRDDAAADAPQGAEA